MKRLATRLGLLAAAVVGLLGAQQPSPDAPAPSASPQDAKGEIAGTVVSAKTGEILKSVPVGLNGGPRGRRAAPQDRVSRSMITGSDGKFDFMELPAGDYEIVCSKVGYGGMRGMPQTAVLLGQNESRKDLMIRLNPGPVVSGRVLDAYGEPLPNAQVFAMARRYTPMKMMWGAMQSASTNDLGEYRLFDLEAGKYVLVAKAGRTPSPEGVFHAEFAPSYYPGAVSLDGAAPVRLAWGDELSGVDFRLGPGYKTTLQGVVIDGDTGQPCGNQCYTMLQDEGFGNQESVATTKEGIFAFHGLAPGPHRLMTQLRSRDSWRLAVEKVQIPESGAAEVKIVVGAGETVSGEVVLEKPPEEKPAENAAAPQDEDSEQNVDQPFFIQLEPKESRMWGPYGRGNVPAQGGPFELPKVPPGDYRIRLRSPGGAGYLKAVSLDGRPLEKPEINVTSGGPLSDLKLTVGSDGASIVGVVTSGAKEGEAGNTEGLAVFLVPEEGTNPYAMDSLNRVQPDGTIKLQGVAPGTYTLYALPFSGADFESAAIRRALEPYSKKLTLSKEEKAQVELTRVPDSVDLW